MSAPADHLLPAPESSSGPTTDVKNIDVSADDAIKLDALGPMVVNSDGTLSRIANWEHMTEIERERTIRVLAARNKIRIAAQEAKEQGADNAST
ncbi:hypothetical protein NLI96_g6778 [Meripilus lineatus]|uniref:Uncharacterized protein n=1 Tax=Meripilus lineatus TaxID=2056292 RepID=A0AAD5V246_9APHY|nr:hypothetical protein NLI96_g6778 [Physisporinus lineatus]